MTLLLSPPSPRLAAGRHQTRRPTLVLVLRTDLRGGATFAVAVVAVVAAAILRS